MLLALMNNFVRIRYISKYSYDILTHIIELIILFKIFPGADSLEIKLVLLGWM